LTLLTDSVTIEHAVIRSWRDKEARKIFERERSRKLPPEIQDLARRKLVMLNASAVLDDLARPPSNRLEKLKGDRAGQWSIAINMQWRICFRWADGTVDDVEIVDYH
jgi:toxin HigB-1